jgi:hypothetical protein
MLLAFVGVVGLWGIGFFSFDLIRTVFNAHFIDLGTEQGLTGPDLAKFVMGLLTSQVYAGYKSVDPALPFRYAGVTICAVFLISLAVLPFAPETKGKPLPE